MIRNVVLDIGGVLADFRWKALMEELGFSKRTIEDLEKRVLLSPLWNELDRGVMDHNDIIAEWIKQSPEYAKEITEFFNHSVDLVAQYDYTESFIKELKKQGLKVYILSNYPDFVFDLHSKTRYTFMSLVDGMVISGYVKMVKPNHDIYEFLLEKYNLKPEECVFLDDRQENIQGARNIGMKGIVFTSYQQAALELQTMLQ